MESGKVVQWNGDSVKHLQPYRTIMMWNGTGGSIAANRVVAVDWSVTTHGAGSAMILCPATEAGEQNVVGGTLRQVPNLSWGEVVVEGIQDGVLWNDLGGAGATAVGDLLQAGLVAGALTLMADQGGVTNRSIVPVARARGAGGSSAVNVEWLNPSQR